MSAARCESLCEYETTGRVEITDGVEWETFECQRCGHEKQEAVIDEEAE